MSNETEANCSSIAWQKRIVTNLTRHNILLHLVPDVVKSVLNDIMPLKMLFILHSKNSLLPTCRDACIAIFLAKSTLLLKKNNSNAIKSYWFDLNFKFISRKE